MKTQFSLQKAFLLILSVSTLSLVSCKKDDDTDKKDDKNNGGKTEETTSTPKFTTGNGAMIAIKANSITSTPIGPITTSIGTAVAAFYDNPAAGTYLDAGSVTAESKTLTKNSNNSYTFIPGSANPTGIDYSGGDVHWEVAGNGTIPTISETITMGFPVVDSINSGSTVTKSSGYTLSTGTVNGADSVIFQVGDVLRTAAGGTTSYTFTAGDLSGLKAGSNIAQIAAYKIDERSTSGKTFHYVNETVVSKTVTIK